MQVRSVKLAFLGKMGVCPQAENRVLRLCKLLVKNMAIRHKDFEETTNVFVHVYNKSRIPLEILRKYEAMVDKKMRKVYNL